MKQLIMSKKCFRTLSGSFAAGRKDKGYTQSELKDLDNIEQRITAALGDYGKKLDDAMSASRRARYSELRGLKDPTVINAIQERHNYELNETLAGIDDAHGDDEVSIDFEDSQFKLAKEVWDAIDNFQGFADAVKVSLAITTAFRATELRELEPKDAPKEKPAPQEAVAATV